MKVKEKVQNAYQKVDDKFFEQFGFKIKDVTFNKLLDYMYCPKDSSSLAVTRILFGKWSFLNGKLHVCHQLYREPGVWIDHFFNKKI